MIYFDNAATTRKKPEAVYQAFEYFVREIGTSPGRGSYSLGIQSSRMLYQSRKTVATFFGVEDTNNVVFTKNSTEAINLFVNGYLKKGNHVIISSYEHNAVLRPLHTLMDKGIIKYTVLPESVFQNPEKMLPQYLNSNTRLAVITLASNLTGQKVYNREFGRVCHQCGVKVFVDASQGAGKALVSLLDDNIDYLAFTGHKDLLGLPGVGGLCTMRTLDIPPLIQGGTGVHGEEHVNPHIYPDAYEAGTVNMPAIWALKAGIEYIQEHSMEILLREKALMIYLINQLETIPNIVIYNADRERVSTVAFNLQNIPSSQVVKFLDDREICVRGGIHCAILAHETLGTVEQGAVRVSINFMNTLEEIDIFLERLREISLCM